MHDKVSIDSRFQDFKISRFQDAKRLEIFQDFKNFKISRFRDFEISRFQDYKISRFSRFHNFKVETPKSQKILQNPRKSRRILRISPKSWKIPKNPPKSRKILRNLPTVSRRKSSKIRLLGASCALLGASWPPLRASRAGLGQFLGGRGCFRRHMKHIPLRPCSEPQTPVPHRVAVARGIWIFFARISGR